MVWTVLGVSWDQLSPLCPCCVLATPCAPPATPLMGWGAGKASTLCQPCSVTKTCLGYRGCVQHKSKPQPIPATRKKIYSAPAQSNTTGKKTLWHSPSKHSRSSHQPAVITTGTLANNFHELSMQYRLFTINKLVLTYLLHTNLLHILEEIQLRATIICKSNETRMPTPARIRSRSLGMTQKQRNKSTHHL